MRATRASLSCSRTALTDAPPTSTIFLSLAATRPSLRARSRHGLGRRRSCVAIAAQTNGIGSPRRAATVSL